MNNILALLHDVHCNLRAGPNSIYFDTMQQTLAHDAAPMRIPFLHIPETDTSDELFLQRERRIKVLAENAHREAQKRRRPSASGDNAEAGAGGWN